MSIAAFQNVLVLQSLRFPLVPGRTDTAHRATSRADHAPSYGVVTQRFTWRNSVRVTEAPSRSAGQNPVRRTEGPSFRSESPSSASVKLIAFFGTRHKKRQHRRHEESRHCRCVVEIRNYDSHRAAKDHLNEGSDGVEFFD